MIPFPDYLDCIARVNELNPPEGKSGDGASPPIQWLFYPGMLQDSPDSWWADFGLRHARHEGLDICFYKKDGRMKPLPPGARVPAMAPGTLLNISGDLLGHTLVVSLDPATDEEGHVVLVYSHTVPDPALAVGQKINQGQIIATTFDTRLKGSRLRSHLHLSCIIIPEDLPGETLDWSLFADRNRVAHINPVFL
ncbi:MAG: M23 family metallopeptidase [Desulfobacterales bacterium]|nr:M23 family metallopeptidase [Desulfobacterales bacterium]